MDTRAVKPFDYGTLCVYVCYMLLINTLTLTLTLTTAVCYLLSLVKVLAYDNK